MDQAAAAELIGMVLDRAQTAQPPVGVADPHTVEGVVPATAVRAKSKGVADS